VNAPLPTNNPFEPPQTDRVETDPDELAIAEADAAAQPEDVIGTSLRRTYGWMCFMAVALVLLAGLCFYSAWNAQNALAEFKAAGEFVPDSYFMYARSQLIYGVFYGIAAVLLVRAAMSVRHRSRVGTVDSLEEAIECQQQFWMYAAVLTIAAFVIALGSSLYRLLDQ
jgi:hypothetical protein